MARTKVQPFQYDTKNNGKVCFICKVPCNRSSREVEFNRGETVMACRPCIQANNLTVVK